jgi:heptaprenyl diphosphate synthase
MASIIYSLTGGILSFLAMYIVMKLFGTSLSLVSISIVGSVFHNLGQLGIAMLILSNAKLAILLPYLFIIAIPTGLFVGLVSNYLLKYLSKNNFNYKNNR